MALKNKIWYSEQVLLELQAGLRNRDEKVDFREVILRMDAIVNLMAKQGFLENWKMGFFDESPEQFLTRFEWLNVTDPADSSPSYFTFPTNYASLPKQSGINQIYFQNDFTQVTKKYFDPVIIMSYKDFTMYRSNMAGNLQGRLGGYVKGQNFYFNSSTINADYGSVGVALMIRDSSQLGDTDLYPIPSDAEQTVISACVDWFRIRLDGRENTIRDNNVKE